MKNVKEIVQTILGFLVFVLIIVGPIVFAALSPANIADQGNPNVQGSIEFGR